MALSKDDQNTFIMITGVLIVCVIALIAIAGSIWQIIREPVNQTINTVSSFLRIQTLDYNFNVTRTTPSPTPQPQPTPQATTEPQQNEQPTNANQDLDYNFPVAGQDEVSEAILSDAELLNFRDAGESVVLNNLSIEIPKLKIKSPIVQSLDAEEALKQGFWVAPSTKELSNGEVTFLCQRRYFGPNDARSCWFLDQLATNDEIIIKYYERVLKYRVTGTNVFAADDPLVYTTSDSEDLIRVVTTHPLYSNENRFVVLAERVF